MDTVKRIGIWKVELSGLSYSGKYRGRSNQIRVSAKVGKDLYMETIYTGWDADKVFSEITVEWIAEKAAKVPHFRPIIHLIKTTTPPIKLKGEK